MDETWNHLLHISRALTTDYGDAVFIGGVAVSCHASRLGSNYQESSHDADLYLSFAGKAAMRDRYEVWHDPKLQKDSTLIEGEELDIYVERQHALGVQYPELFAASEEIEGIRVAALEHLLILKLDAAKSRWGSGKGDKDMRDLARIVALLGEPKHEWLDPHLNSVRLETLDRVMGRNDLPRLLGLNHYESGKFRVLLDMNLRKIARNGQAPPHAPPEEPLPPPPKPSFGRRQWMNSKPTSAHSFAPCGADLEIPLPLPLGGMERIKAMRLRPRTIAEVCSEAAVRCRVTGGPTPRVVLWNSPHHGYTVDHTGMPFYAVSKIGLPQRKQQRALKILEILAYGFQDYMARESVCGRGFFIYPVTPESGRVWLAEIGKRGGSVRSAVKSSTSANNGRSRSNVVPRPIA